MQESLEACGRTGLNKITFGEDNNSGSGVSPPMKKDEFLDEFSAGSETSVQGDGVINGFRSADPI